MSAPAGGRRRGVVAFVLLVLVATAAGALWWRATSTEASIETPTLYGTIDVREVHLAFQDIEHVDSVLVEEGDRVTTGQLLATQDQTLLAAQAAAASAETDARRAALARLEAGTRSEDIRKARADVEAAAALLREAESTARRMQKLILSGAVDRQRAEDAVSAADTARARWKAAKATLDLAIAGPRAEDVAEARAVLARANAQLDLVRERLDDMQMYAPNDGIVRQRILEPGDIAAPDRAVLVLALTDPIWVRAYAPEAMLGHLRDGMAAEVRSDSFPDKRYRGWVGFVSPTAEFTPKTVQTEALRTSLVYQVRVFVCNPNGELRLGMPVTVRLTGAAAGANAGTTAGKARCAADDTQ